MGNIRHQPSMKIAFVGIIKTEKKVYHLYQNPNKPLSVSSKLGG